MFILHKTSFLALSLIHRKGGLFLLLFSFLFLFSGCAIFQPTDQRLHTFHTVVIDPGHGGNDSGTRAVNGMNEKTLTLDVARRLKPLLEDRGYHVVMTRSEDKTVSLAQRVAISNAEPKSIFVSIHFNASPSRRPSGVETYYYYRPSEPLAAAISKELGCSKKCHHRGVKQEIFYVLNHNRRPATLVELGFISNRKENTAIQKPATRQLLAEQIDQGIANVRKK